MKLVCQVHEKLHSDFVPACGWTPNDRELITCSDDETMRKISSDFNSVELLQKTKDFGFVTDMAWAPSINANNKSESLAVCAADGSFRIMSASADMGAYISFREEKHVEIGKEHGAVTSIAWNADGTALATGNEDGSVKIWSRVGMLRHSVAATGHAVYALCWGRNDELLFSVGKEIVIEHPGEKTKKCVQWKAHDGIILCAAWNGVTQLIVTGGEDCKYRVWDCFGRQVFQSSPAEHVITSVRWHPRGSCFAFGSFDIIGLCDKSGASMHVEDLSDTSTGSILSLCWSNDGTMLGATGAKGSVVVAHCSGREVEWKDRVAQLVDENRVEVNDRIRDVCEVVQLVDRILDISMGWDHLLVHTASPQIHVYKLSDLQNPTVLDTNVSHTLLLQSSKYFLAGWTVYTYEGRKVEGPKLFTGVNVKLLSTDTLAMSATSLAMVETSTPSNRGVIRVVKLSSGKSQSQPPIQHDMEIVQIALSQANRSEILAFVDRNRDVFLSQAGKKTTKLPATAVESIAFHRQANTLVALADGGARAVLWEYPPVAWIDPDLLDDTTTSIDTPSLSSQLPTIHGFDQNTLSVRKQDGGVVALATSPYPAMLHRLVGNEQQRRWEDAIRLCRLVQVRSLWATLAVRALEQPHLATAEIALSAIERADKLEFILHVKACDSEKERNAKLAFFRRDFAAAEQILLHANPPLLYRAIKMNLRMFRWERARSIAKKDTDLMRIVELYRQRWETQQINKEEMEELQGLKRKFKTVDGNEEQKQETKTREE